MAYGDSWLCEPASLRGCRLSVVAVPFETEHREDENGMGDHRGPQQASTTTRVVRVGTAVVKQETCPDQLGDTFMTVRMLNSIGWIEK
jgi:hypothetical protein